MSSSQTCALEPGLRDSRVSGEAAVARCVATLLSWLLSTEQSRHLVFSPELDALASCVKDQLGVDTDPRVAGSEGRPVADELHRRALWQGAGPPTGVVL